jgi:hypothetical protein
MIRKNSSLITGARLLLAAGALWLAGASAASAQSTLVFSGDAGDYISQGRTWSYIEGVQGTASSDQRVVSISVWTDTWWNLEFAAPQGAQLLPGVYESATRYPFNDAHEPGLSLSGDGRGCNTLTGRFEVHEAVYGPFGYLVKFHASFEQHCEGGPTAAYGEVVINNPPPPEALTVSVQFDPKFTVKRRSGLVTVGGTVTCSEPSNANINGSLVQRVNRFSVAQAGFYANTACGPTPTRFSTVVTSASGVPFGGGQAQLDATVSAYDPNYGGEVTETVSTVVSLTSIK